MSPFDQAILDEGIFGTPLEAIARKTRGFESSGNPNAVSNRGARGGMQVMPATFASLADQGWDINNDYHNSRAGIRYLRQGWDKSGGDAALTGAYYYGGPNGLNKARKGVAVSDPMNPSYPNTLEYGKRLADSVNGGNTSMNPNQGGTPPAGMQDYVRQAQSLIGTTQPSPELIEAITRNSQSRGQNLPLAMGAMLSRDQSMQKFGNTLYDDANTGRDLKPLGDDGFVDPMTGSYLENPAGTDKKKQRVLEMSLRLAQQAEDAAARRAQNQQQYETRTILQQAMQSIAQQNADTAGSNAKTAQDGQIIRQKEFDTKQAEESKILELIAQPNSPFKSMDDYKRNGGTVRNLAEKRINEMRDEVKGLNQTAAAMDEFYELNQRNPTGDIYDTLARNTPLAFQTNPDKQRMMQLNSTLQTGSVPSGQGAVSNLERELFSTAVPGLQFTTDANNASHKAFNLRKSFREDSVRFMEDYFTKNGHLNGADQEAVAFLKAKYTPLLSGGATGGGAQSGGTPSGPPPAAVDFLRKNNTPENRAAFQSKYGSLPGGI
jgi:hypothetical protein